MNNRRRRGAKAKRAAARKQQQRESYIRDLERRGFQVIREEDTWSGRTLLRRTTVLSERQMR